jgi:iron complex transport system substrate-binding protein
MRIASLLPSATELLYAVGAGGDLVGRTHECDYPPEAESLPVLTSSAIDHDGQTCAAIDRHVRRAVHEGSSLYRLDEQRLRSVAPDLIVTQELCEVCAVAYAEVRRAARRLPGDVPVISLEPTSLDDICATAGVVGEASGHATEGAQLAARLAGRITEIDGVPPPRSVPRVVCLEWTDPLMAGGHWVPEMVRRAGGRDVLGIEGQLSTIVAWDDVVEAAPDVMVLMPCGFDLERTLAAANDVTARPGFAQLPCARSDAVAAVDGSSYFNRPGPRIVDGLALLAAIFRTRPGAPLPAGAQWVAN